MMTPEQYAEAWWRGQGRIVPDRATQLEEWEKMFQRWLVYVWHPRLKAGKAYLHREGEKDGY